MNLIGTKLGRYEIQSSLGTGGMGEVYRARDPQLDRVVAVKLISTSLASDATRVARFQQEARAAATLNHPNILAVHDLGTENGSPYIVSELLEGETLRAKLAAGPLPVRKAIDYALQIARGLAAAHDKGIVHRDLKPENIFVTHDGRVKILDFGLAKLTRDAAGDDATRTVASDVNSVVGTVGYMSPEQARGKLTDARSDLFALGAILYEMLSGKRAFRGDSTADTISAILHHDPPELTSQNASVPPALDRIVSHCLEKSPDERFQAARDVAFDIESLSASSTATTLEVVRSRRNRRALLVSGVLLVLVATGRGNGVARARANFAEGMKLGWPRRAEQAFPGVGTDAHDAGERAFEVAKTNGTQKRGEIGTEGKYRDAIFVTRIDRDDEKNCGPCERRGNELRDGTSGYRRLDADWVGCHWNSFCLLRVARPSTKQMSWQIPSQMAGLPLKKSVGVKSRFGRAMPSGPIRPDNILLLRPKAEASVSETIHGNWAGIFKTELF
jgi:serine/threonine protein kinase